MDVMGEAAVLELEKQEHGQRDGTCVHEHIEALLKYSKAFSFAPRWWILHSSGCRWGERAIILRQQRSEDASRPTTNETRYKSVVLKIDWFLYSNYGGCYRNDGLQ